MRNVLALAVMVTVGAAGASGHAEPRVKAGDVSENSIGMKLVAIPAGEFDMGSNESEEDDERPVHRVRITTPFFIGQTEVTQGQWETVMGTTPWKGKAYIREGENFPATYVSWDDAVEFCRKLTEREREAGRLPAGASYRLPTEAEWEYACRAGTTTTWSFGEDQSRLKDHAWFGGNAWNTEDKYAHAVGLKAPNPWKLHDMHGNVWEWCSDRYEERYYGQGVEADPSGPPSAGALHVLRGGSYFSNPGHCRSAYRFVSSPTLRFSRYGVRVVREAP